MLKRGDNISWGSINVPVIAITINANEFFVSSLFSKGQRAGKQFHEKYTCSDI